MTTYELARQLLSGRNEPVFIVSKEGSLEPVCGRDVLNDFEVKSGKDIKGNPLPETFTVVIGNDTCV